MSTLRDTLLNERRESKAPRVSKGSCPSCGYEFAVGPKTTQCPSCNQDIRKAKKNATFVGYSKTLKRKVAIPEEESLDTPNLDMIFEAGMSVAEIAKKEGVSRQIVHRQLKSAAGKMYNAMKQATNGSPFKVLLSLAVALNINSQEDFNELKRMLPADIIKDVEADAKNYIRK